MHPLARDPGFTDLAARDAYAADAAMRRTGHGDPEAGLDDLFAAELAAWNEGRPGQGGRRSTT